MITMSCEFLPRYDDDARQHRRRPGNKIDAKSRLGAAFGIDLNFFRAGWDVCGRRLHVDIVRTLTMRLHENRAIVLLHIVLSIVIVEIQSVPFISVKPAVVFMSI